MDTQWGIWFLPRSNGGPQGLTIPENCRRSSLLGHRDAACQWQRLVSSGAPGQKTSKIEPDFVAALVICAMRDIATAWTVQPHSVGIDLKL